MLYTAVAVQSDSPSMLLLLKAEGKIFDDQKKFCLKCMPFLGDQEDEALWQEWHH